MIEPGSYPLLESIDEPAHLREMPASQLPQLASQLRSFLLESVARSGGHLAAGLGVVELTIALHYVFDTPDDRLVWDVGHQCYPHKILTGRRRHIHTVRKQGGVAGFPKRDESPYDTFGVGHSSTAISAALGMAEAARLVGAPRKAVAVIGDGGMTAGEAFEALNHGGDVRPDLLVVLNDNEMSISENVGALSHALNRMLSNRLFRTLREGGKAVLAQMPRELGDLARRAEGHVRGMLLPPGTFFEELGFDYYGPIDGHDLDALVPMLERLRALDGPRLLHVVTRKGKGYARAEADPIAYHGVKAFDPGHGLSGGGSGAKTYTQVFSDWICDMAEQDARLVAITPAMREGSGLVAFARRFSERYYDVGIAEQHSATLAAGLACDGAHPVLAIYSTFLQRAYDQLIHDIALQRLPVLLAIDRGGVVGADGPTHHGAFDLSYLRCIPNMVVMTPADENECRQMLYTGLQTGRPAAVRYPRGTGPGVEVERPMRALPVGQAELRRQGREVALLAFGSMVREAEAAAAQLDATVVNMRFVKPLDEAIVRELAGSHRLLVSIEENVIAGGAGSAVAESLHRHRLPTPLLQLGLPDAFVPHGDPGALLADLGLDAAGIVASVRRRLEREMGETPTSGGGPSR